MEKYFDDSQGRPYSFPSLDTTQTPRLNYLNSNLTYEKVDKYFSMLDLNVGDLPSKKPNEKAFGKDPHSIETNGRVLMDKDPDTGKLIVKYDIKDFNREKAKNTLALLVMDDVLRKQDKECSGDELINVMHTYLRQNPDMDNYFSRIFDENLKTLH